MQGGREGNCELTFAFTSLSFPSFSSFLRSLALQGKPMEVRLSNMTAAKSVSDAVRTSLGPKGMDKMVSRAGEKEASKVLARLRADPLPLLLFCYRSKLLRERSSSPTMVPLFSSTWPSFTLPLEWYVSLSLINLLARRKERVGERSASFPAPR